MKKPIPIYSFILILCLCGCHSSHTRHAIALLQQAEQQMEQHPDSALMALKEIIHPEKLTQEMQARHALLLTLALDKNYLDSLQSLPLIRRAADYYRTTSNDLLAGKSLFYYGKMLALLCEEDSLAIEAYQEAQSRLEHTTEYKLLAFIHEYTGYLYYDRGLYEQVLPCYRRALHYGRLAGDTVSTSFACINIAQMHIHSHQYDSAYHYIQEAIATIGSNKQAQAYPSLMQTWGRIAEHDGAYKEAIHKYQEAIKYDKINYIGNYLLLGNIYRKMGNVSQARTCFLHGLESTNIQVRSYSYHHLYLLEKQLQNYPQALRNKELSDSLLNLYQDQSTRSKLLTLQRKYENEKLQMENQILSQEKKIQFYFQSSLCLLLVIIGITGYTLYRRRRKQWEQNTRQQEARLHQSRETIRQHLHTIEKLESQDLLKEQEIARLKQYTLHLQSEENHINQGIHTLYLLREHQLILSHMTATEKQSLFMLTDFLYDNLVQEARITHHLTEDNLMLLSLLKFKFDNELLSFIFDCTGNTLSKRKQRLLKTLETPPKFDR